MNTLVRPWFGLVKFDPASEGDRRGGSGSRPRLDDVRPVRTTYSREWPHPWTQPFTRVVVSRDHGRETVVQNGNPQPRT